MTLFCLIYKRKNARPFPVTACKNETIASLKESIKLKKQNGLEYHDADTLDLFQVCLLEENSEGLKNFVPEDSKMLLSTWKVGKYFKGDPREESVHLIVRVPGK